MDERDREYCQQALMDGEKALAYYGQAGRQWAQNEMAADAIAKRIESFCEYVDRISLAERARRPGFPWQEIRGMRNRLAHAYHHIDVRIIQELLDVYLPRDLAAMRAWLAEDSSFMVAAASEKAEQVITARTTTILPADYFDRLVSAIDHADRAPRLARAAKAAARHRRIA